MNKVFTKYLKGDKIIWIIFIGLCILSIIVLFSASSTLAFKSDNHTSPIIKHTVFLLLGATIAFLVHLIPYKNIRFLGYIGFFISLGLLIYVSARGIAANEAKRWMSIFGVEFQPSEIAKLSLVIVVADLVSRVRANPAKESRYFKGVLFASAPILLLIFLENFSTAAILGLVVLAIMFLGRISSKKLLSLTGAILAGLILLFAITAVIPAKHIPKPLERITTWQNRFKSLFQEKTEENKYEIRDDNRQVQYARIAVAQGEFFGVMPGNSVQRDYLPHAYDDFIYSIIIEEMGLLGGIVVMFLYLWLFFRTGQIASICKSSFPALLVTGLGMIITLQAVVNMLVGSGFGLVTGQPLPMISRGGTSILITSTYFGIILGIIRQIKEENKPDFYLDSDDEEEIEEVIDIEAV